MPARPPVLSSVSKVPSSTEIRTRIRLERLKAPFVLYGPCDKKVEVRPVWLAWPYDLHGLNIPHGLHGVHSLYGVHACVGEVHLSASCKLQKLELACFFEVRSTNDFHAQLRSTSDFHVSELQFTNNFPVFVFGLRSTDEFMF